MNFLANIKNAFADFLFPKSRRVLELEALSADMLTDILPQAENLKDKNTVALFDYSHPMVKEIIWELKYNGNTEIARTLGEMFYDYIRHAALNFIPDDSKHRPILMPIPVSGKRRSERGWNQSELLAEQIIKHDSEKMMRYMPGQLYKCRHTESQTKTASKKERLENLANSMKILNPSSVAGEHIVIVDDVTTTGATFTEARRALETAGAKKVLCIAVAH